MDTNEDNNILQSTEKSSSCLKLYSYWNSVTYSNVHGMIEFQINPDVVDAMRFKINIILAYGNDSKFRPNTKKVFELICIRDLNRIFAQTELNTCQQFSMTLAFDKPIISGFYSSILPIDCGTIKTIESKINWKSAFGFQ